MLTAQLTKPGDATTKELVDAAPLVEMSGFALPTQAAAITREMDNFALLLQPYAPNSVV